MSDLTPRDELAALLGQHRIECTGLEGVTCRGCREAGWMSLRSFNAHVADVLLAAGWVKTPEPAEVEWGACCRLNGSAEPGYYRGTRNFADEGVTRLKAMYPAGDVVLVRRRAAVPAGPWEVVGE